MSILDHFFNVLGYTKAAKPQPAPMVVATAQAASYNWPDGSQFEYQARLYAALSWIHTAITIYSQIAASTELDVLRAGVEGQEDEDIPNHDFETLLMHPNPLQSRFEFLEAAFAFYRLNGNCFWWLNRAGRQAGPPVELWVIPPTSIRPVPNGNLFVDGYEYDPGTGQTFLIGVDEVVHFKSFNPSNPFVGLSAVQSLAMVSGGDLAQQKWNANLFAKENAKLPGALAFKDMILNPDWLDLQKQIKEQWGGTNRSGPLMLRGVGQGGVEWMQIGMTQDEMQFLESRTFTKEEIFSVLAPGLASMLSVNATEANAKTGKATLIDLAVWPSLVSVAEKITNNLLPMYGESLKAKFEDIRITDRVLEMQEIDQYSRFHTVAEVRKEKYGDQALGDERDALIVSQIGPATQAVAEPAVQSAPPDTEYPTEQQPVIDAVMADLERWQRKAVKRMKESGAAGCEFSSVFIPVALKAAIDGQLEMVRSVEQVKVVFENARSWRDYP